MKRKHKYQDAKPKDNQSHWLNLCFRKRHESAWNRTCVRMTLANILIDRNIKRSKS